MNRTPIILIGTGGHCKSVIDVIESGNEFEITGIISKDFGVAECFLGYPVIGDDGSIESLAAAGANFHIAVGQIEYNQVRIHLFNRIRRANGKMPFILSPTAKVSKRAVIDDGTIVMHNAFVNSSARVGLNCIINTGAVVEHDSRVGNHCHISTGAFVNGSCLIGDNSFIGSNATILNGVTIADGNIIGAGSVVVKDTNAGHKYVGNPANKIK